MLELSIYNFFDINEAPVAEGLIEPAAAAGVYVDVLVLSFVNPRAVF